MIRTAVLSMRSAMVAVLLIGTDCATARADAAFDQFLQSLWPEAEKLGVSRPIFEAATRAALGAYQKANGLKLDCWPTAEVLAHMRQKK
jgi:membrane-bound lytic murein transglycosylase B